MMAMPENYKYEYVIYGDIPYECVDDSSKGTQGREGILQTGRLVWTLQPKPDDSAPAVVTGFVDGIGLISVDSRHLRPCM